MQPALTWCTPPVWSERVMTAESMDAILESESVRGAGPKRPGRVAWGSLLSSRYQPVSTSAWSR